ncbi:hypothetical protein G205_10937 [Arthrobacter nitrophenolicus]|uniref:Uncharacterized protein n=2 Tax=Arthrobacter nitrophenolicus TaxID=683150 RepID=L8TSJ4_9MICC|nr:hypothetical protein G205_10937 [Arthrobacter nitrophenolicus]
MFTRGRIMWMAHSKLSNVPVWLAMVTVNMRPSWLPQTSQVSMIIPSLIPLLQTLSVAAPLAAG